MDRWDWVAIRAYWPAVVVLVGSFASFAIFSQIPQASPLSGVLSLLKFVPLGGLAASAFLIVAPTYRILRWQKHAGPDCPPCGGPLGFERLGSQRMGGAYRQCYACGDNVNHRHYRQH